MTKKENMPLERFLQELEELITEFEDILGKYKDIVATAANTELLASTVNELEGILSERNSKYVC